MFYVAFKLLWQTNEKWFFIYGYLSLQVRLDILWTVYKRNQISVRFLENTEYFNLTKCSSTIRGCIPENLQITPKVIKTIGTISISLYCQVGRNPVQTLTFTSLIFQLISAVIDSFYQKINKQIIKFLTNKHAGRYLKHNIHNFFFKFIQLPIFRRLHVTVTLF